MWSTQDCGTTVTDRPSRTVAGSIPRIDAASRTTTPDWAIARSVPMSGASGLLSVWVGETTTSAVAVYVSGAAAAAAKAAPTAAQVARTTSHRYVRRRPRALSVGPVSFIFAVLSLEWWG